MTLPRFVLVVRPGPAGGSRVAPYFSISLVAHLVFLLFLVLGPTLGNRRPVASDALVAVLVPGVPAASLAARAPTPPAPKPPKPEPPKPEPPKPEPAKAPSKAIPLPDKTGKKPAPKKETPVPEPAKPSGGTPGPEPGPSPPAGGGTGAGITSLDAGDVEFAWYRALVTSALKSRWVRPVLEGGAQDAIVASVSFEIRRDGSVGDLRVDASSGVPAMDRSVLRAVMEAAPLPPLPPSWRDPTLPARFEFRWRAGDTY